MDEEAGSRPKIHVQERGNHQRVPLDEITHITAEGDYSRLNFLEADGLPDTRSLRYWESALTPRRFVRISRSVIVNLDCVEGLDRRRGDWKLELRGVEKPVSVGRNYRTDLKYRLES